MKSKKIKSKIEWSIRFPNGDIHELTFPNKSTAIHLLKHRLGFKSVQEANDIGFAVVRVAMAWQIEKPKQ
jgi:hypothetical protein